MNNTSSNTKNIQMENQLLMENQRLSNEKEQKLQQITSRVYSHFITKYPESFKNINMSQRDVRTILEKAIFTRDGKIMSGDELKGRIQRVIGLVEDKVKKTTYGNNRRGQNIDIGSYKIDEESTIGYDKYVNENFQHDLPYNINNYDKQLNNEQNNREEGRQTNHGNLEGSNNNVNQDGNIEVALNSYRGLYEDAMKQFEKQNQDLEYLKSRMLENNKMTDVKRSFDYTVIIDSKDRDYTKNPNPNEFEISFSPSNNPDSENKGFVVRGFNNIICCELLDVIILDTNDEPDSSDNGTKKIPYLILELPELQTNYDGTNDNINRAFALLTTYETLWGYRHYKIMSNVSDTTVKKTYNPRINLSKLTVKLLLPDGTPYSFGENNLSNEDTVIKLSFRISVVQKNLESNYIQSSTF